MAKRVLAFLVVLIIVATIGFVFFRVLPADPALYAIPSHVSPDTPGLQELRDIFNKPLPAQYVDYMSRTFTGQFGIELRFADYHIGDFIYGYVLRSLFLFGVTSILSILFGVLYVRRAARKQKRVLEGPSKWISVGLFSLPVLGIGLLVMSAASHSSLPIRGFWSPDYFDKDLAGKIGDILLHAILPMLSCFLCSVGVFFLILKEGTEESTRQGGQGRKGSVAASMQAVAPYMPFFFAWALMSSMVIDALAGYSGLGLLTFRVSWAGVGFQTLEAIFFLAALLVMVSSLAFDLTASMFVLHRSTSPKGTEASKALEPSIPPSSENTRVAPSASFLEQCSGITSDFVRSWQGRVSLALFSILVVIAVVGVTVKPEQIAMWPPDLLKSFLSGSTMPVATAIVLAALSSAIGLLVGVALGYLGKSFDWPVTTLIAALMAVPFACLLVPRFLFLLESTGTPSGLQIFVTGIRAVLTASCALVAVVVSRSTIRVIESHRSEWKAGGWAMSSDRVFLDVLSRVSSDALRAAKFATVVGVLAISTASFWGLSVRNGWGSMLERAWDLGAVELGRMEQVWVPMLGILLLCFTMFLMLDTAAKVLKKRYPD